MMTHAEFRINQGRIGERQQTLTSPRSLRGSWAVPLGFSLVRGEQNDLDLDLAGVAHSCDAYWETTNCNCSLWFLGTFVNGERASRPTQHSYRPEVGPLAQLSVFTAPGS